MAPSSRPPRHPKDVLGPESPGRQEPRGQVGGHHQGFLPHVQGDVVKIGMRRDGQVGGQGPGGGGPDDQGDVLQAPQFGKLRRRANQGKFHEDGRGLVLLVLHLGFGQGGSAGGAPVDGLFAAVRRRPLK